MNSTLFINTVAAHTLDNIYLKIGTGRTKYKDFNDTLIGYSERPPEEDRMDTAVGIGYKLNDYIETDFNIQYNRASYNDDGDMDETTEDEELQKITSVAFFLNCNYIFFPHKAIRPYLTAGIGLSRNTANDFGLSRTLKGSTRTSFIWNAGVGIKFHLSKKLALDFEYKYLDLGFIKTASSPPSSKPFINMGKQKLRGNQIMIALIYNFNNI